MSEDYIKKSDVMRLLKKHHRNGGTDVDGDWVEGSYSESLYEDIENLPVVQKQIEKDSHYDEFGFVDPFSFGKENEMTLFKIIDRETGKEPTDEVITAEARLGNLIPCDIDGFYVGEDGEVILVDDCGNCTWLGDRFKVELQTGASPTSPTGAERSDKE